MTVGSIVRETERTENCISFASPEVLTSKATGSRGGSGAYRKRGALSAFGAIKPRASRATPTTWCEVRTHSPDFVLQFGGNHTSTFLPTGSWSGHNFRAVASVTTTT